MSIIATLSIFAFQFPRVEPTYPEVREIGQAYQELPQPKCLYVEGMPYESLLLY